MVRQVSKSGLFSLFKNMTQNFLPEEDFEKLKKREESLWIAKTRFDNDYMEQILAPDFFEFGRSGKTYQRSDTLSHEYREINATLPLKNFKIHPVSDDTVLITYISEVQDETLEIGNRSSLWIKTPTGWQLRFHQGTIVKN